MGGPSSAPPGPGGTGVGLGIGLGEQKDPLLRVRLKRTAGPSPGQGFCLGVEWGFCKI